MFKTNGVRRVRNMNPINTNKGFPKSARLRRQVEFDRTYASKVYAADGVLVVNAIRSSVGETRLGLSVSKKVGNAVVRNRWKRLIREAFRQQRLQFPAGIDLVVRPRKGARLDYRSVARSLPKLAQRCAQRLSRGAS